MSDATKSPGQIALAWWKKNLRPDEDTGPARALRARLRRADHVTDVLAEGRVIELHDLLLKGADARVLRALKQALENPRTLAALAQVLAHVERHDGQLNVAEAFGEEVSGDRKKLTSHRFQQLLRAKNPQELATGLRRALPVIGRDSACNVAALAEDILFWGEKPRIRWCFDYYGAAPPRPVATEEETE